MNIKLYIICFWILMAEGISAQDFHLSQYDAASQYLNPATTGMGFGKHQGDYRINADFRSQWRSLGHKPFTTSYLGYDMHYNDRWGIGGFIINQRAGAGKVNTLNFMLSGAYNVAVDQQGHHFFSGGLQLGVFQRSIQYEDFTFNDQYSAAYGGYDPNLSNNESFPSSSIFRMDGSVGIYYSNKDDKKKINPFGGLGIHHILRPNESFSYQQKYRLPIRYAFNAGLHYQMNEQFKFTPNMLLMYQAKATEINVGVMANYTLNKSDNDVMLGVSYRTKDAVIIHVGFKQGLNVYRLSYDINTSSLSKYTRNRGGYELSVVYTGTNKKKSQHRRHRHHSHHKRHHKVHGR